MADKHQTELSPDVQARIDFVHSVVPKRAHHHTKLVILVSLAVVAIAVGAWLIAGSSSGPKAPTKAQPKIAKVTSLSASAKTTTYNSTDFGFKFSYPVSWKLLDNNKGLLTLTSPLTHLTNAVGKTVNGQVILTVQKQAQLPSGFTAGTNLAVLNSQLITFTAPSQDQSAQTYISYVQYSSTNTKGGLNGIYLTGNYGIGKDEVVTANEVESVTPVMMVTFSQCQNKTCHTLTPVTLSSAAWQASPAAQIITNLFESLTFD